MGTHNEELEVAAVRVKCFKVKKPIAMCPAALPSLWVLIVVQMPTGHSEHKLCFNFFS